MVDIIYEVAYVNGMLQNVERFNLYNNTKIVIAVIYYTYIKSVGEPCFVMNGLTNACVEFHPVSEDTKGKDPNPSTQPPPQPPKRATYL